MCFSSAYIPSLLDAYSLPRDDNRSVRYARKVHGFTASWALGAQLFYIEEMKCEIAAAGAPAGNGTGCKPPEPRMREEIEVGAAMVLTLVLGALWAQASSISSRAGSTGRLVSNERSTPRCSIPPTTPPLLTSCSAAPGSDGGMPKRASNSGPSAGMVACVCLV